MSEAAVSHELIALVYREAQSLDEQRWDDWIALYAAECRYWVPLSTTHTDGRREQSIAFEDRMLLDVRVERLKAGRAPSQHPPARSQHVLQAPIVDLETLTTRAAFLYIEARNESQQLLAGTVTHHFTRENGVLKIAMKRIDLVNAQAMLPTIFLII